MLLREKTENARDNNVTIHYRRKLRMREILTSQSSTGEKNRECGDTNFTIDY